MARPETGSRGTAPDTRCPSQGTPATGTGSAGPHDRHSCPQHVDSRPRRPPGGGRPDEGERPCPEAPRNGVTKDGGGRAPNAHTHTRTPARRTSVRAPQPEPRSAHSTYASYGKSAADPLLLGRATQQWRNPWPHAKHAPDLRRWTQHMRSSGRRDSEAVKETPCKRTRGRTPTWRKFESPPRAARPRNLRRRQAACPRSAPRGNGATAPEKAGAPSSTPSPAPLTERCPRWDTRPQVPPYATGWRRAGSWIRPRAAA